jgi:hypothetical protein
VACLLAAVYSMGSVLGMIVNSTVIIRLRTVRKSVNQDHYLARLPIDNVTDWDGTIRTVCTDRRGCRIFHSLIQSRQKTVFRTTYDLIVSRFAEFSFWRIIDLQSQRLVTMLSTIIILLTL